MEESIIKLLHRHESSISGLQARLDKDEPSPYDEQVKLLQAIHAQLASQSTPLQFIWNAVLQTVVVITAFLFGMFSIFSWHGQYLANKMTAEANAISLISLCLSNNVTTSACGGVVDRADDALAFLLGVANVGGNAVEGSNAWPWRVPPDRDLTVLMVYIFVPTLAGVLGSFACWKIYHERGRQSCAYSGVLSSKTDDCDSLTSDLLPYGHRHATSL